MSTGADIAPQRQGITVTGTGRAAAVPDLFVLVVGAEAASDHAAEAMSEAGSALDRIRAAALAHGVRPEHLVTRNLVLRQGYDHQGRPRGVVCELGLSVRSGDVARAGELVSACVTAGGDLARLHSASFEHADPTALLRSAREAAYTDASARAAQLAALAGRELGQVVQIVESAPAFAPLHEDLAVTMKASGPPVDAGTLDAAASVTVHWQWR